MPNAETTNARKVLSHARDSVDGFLSAFTELRRARGAAGAPTDEDQDLARAAVVFAAAGLDSCIKHLIKESLESLADCDPDVGDKFKKFVTRMIDKGSAANLAGALLSDSTRKYLLEQYIYELTGSSLQSFDELAKAASALGIDFSTLSKKKSDLIQIFQDRNKIIHELDVKFDAQVGQRQRNSRSKTNLERDARLLLRVGDTFVAEVDKKLDKR